MFISGLGHVLSISGYHMAVVAGIVFFAVRGSLALVPVLALRYAIKKWAALAALGAAFFYLLLSGAEVATQRSFIMTAIVLVGVMIDRAALTLRTLALAALACSSSPRSRGAPKFPDVVCGNAGADRRLPARVPWMQAGAETPRGARVALWGGREIAALIVVSLAAGCATMPYAAFTFTGSLLTA